MTIKATGRIGYRWTLRVVALITLIVFAVPFVLGTLFTLFALSPATDMGDANILIRQAPPYALLGLAGLILVPFIWDASARPTIPTYATTLAALAVLGVAAFTTFVAYRIATKSDSTRSGLLRTPPRVPTPPMAHVFCRVPRIPRCLS